MKRPSCKWKGQIDVNEDLLETQVARIAKCHLKQKAGYGQDASYSVKNSPKKKLNIVTNAMIFLVNNYKNLMTNIVNDLI